MEAQLQRPKKKSSQRSAARTPERASSSSSSSSGVVRRQVTNIPDIAPSGTAPSGTASSGSHAAVAPSATIAALTTSIDIDTSNQAPPSTLGIIVPTTVDTTALWDELRRIDDAALAARLATTSMSDVGRYPQALTASAAHDAAVQDAAQDSAAGTLRPLAQRSPSPSYSLAVPCHTDVHPSPDTLAAPRASEQASASEIALGIAGPALTAMYPSVPVMAGPGIQHAPSAPSAPMMIDRHFDDRLPQFPFQAHANPHSAQQSQHEPSLASAPSLQDFATVYNQQATAPSLLQLDPSQSAAADARQSLSREPITDSAWSAVCIAEMQTPYADHVALVQEFRSNSNRQNTSDPFYEKVLLYETAFKNTGRIRSQLNAARLSAKHLSGRLWTLSRIPKQASAVCRDGRTVSHSYIDELAAYNTDVEHELIAAWKSIHSLYHSHLTKNLFENKMSKIWIQNSLDSFMAARFQPSLEGAQTRPFSFVDGWETVTHIDQDMRQLLHYLNVLFLFERRNVSTNAQSDFHSDSLPQIPQSSWSGQGQPPGTPPSPSTLAGIRRISAAATAPVPVQLASPMSTTGPSDSQPAEQSLFVKDVRVIIRAGGPLAHREVLLHALRCRGIGAWGSHFQWAKHYLASLRAFLGPVEELEELEVQQSTNLKRLEVEDEWVVVDETLFSPPPPRSVLLCQFNVHHAQQSFVLPHLNGQSSFLLALLRRAFESVPSNYRVFLGLLCDTAVSLSCLMAKHVSEQASSGTAADSVLGHSSRLPSMLVLWHLHAARLVRLFLAHGHAATFSSLLDMPLSRLSLAIRHEMFLIALSASSYTMRDSTETAPSLSVVLLRDSGQGVALIQFLVELLGVDHGKDAASQTSRAGITNVGSDGTIHAASDPTLASDVTLLVDTIFQSVLLHAEMQGSLLDAAIDSLAVLGTRFPGALPRMLHNTWSHFQALEALVNRIYAKLPVEKWPMDTSDLKILQNMLNDPVSSARFRFAQMIMDRLDWTMHADNGMLLIPVRHQRALAIHLAHRMLDRSKSGETQPGIVAATLSATTAATRATVDMVSKQVLPFPVPVPAMFQDPEKVFEDWCWKVVTRMQLYQQPASFNVYAASAYDRPFESLSSPMIATLFAYAESNAFAAYIVLLVSELGHHHRPFETRGWPLLFVLLNKGPPAAFLHAAFTLLQTFVGRMVWQLFAGFFRSRPTLDESSLTDPDNKAGQFIFDTLRLGAAADTSEPDSRFAASFWLKAAFADKDWMHIPVTLAILDAMCELYIRAGRHSMLHGPLVAEYHSMLAGYYANQSSAFRFSYTRPVESILSLATTIEYLGSSFPTLVPLYARDQSISATLGQMLRSDRRHWPWLAYEALLVESMSERDAVRTIGLILTRHPQMPIQQAITGGNPSSGSGTSGSASSCFSIFRWASYILELPQDHPSMPLLWQGFFSLYFERSKPESPSSSMAYGHRFLSSNPQLLERLVALLEQLKTRLELMPHAPATPSSAANAQLTQLYCAMSLWLKEPKLLSQPDAFAADPAYQIPRLHECSLFSSEIATTAWLALLRPMKSIVQQQQQTTQTAQSTDSTDAATSGSFPHTSQLARRSSVSAAIGTLVMSAAPPVGFRSPLIPAMDTLTLQAVSDMFDRELAIVIDASRASATVSNRLESLNASCLDNLRQLYTAHKRRVQVEKSCSTRCEGHAIVQCDLQEATLNVDLRNLANDHAQQVDLILSTDHVDSRLCLCGLKVLRAMDWLAFSLNASTGQSAVSSAPSESALASPTTGQTLERIFFSASSALGKASASYAPALFLADVLVRQLGPRVLDLSQDQTRRIFKLLEQRENVPLLARVFDPCRAPAQFPQYYESLSRVLMDDAEATLVLETFAMDRWILSIGIPTGTEQQTSGELQRQMFDVLLHACETRPAMAIFERHLQSLMSLKPGPFWLECIPLLLESAIQGRIGVDVLRHLMPLVGADQRASPDAFDQFLSRPLLSNLPLDRDTTAQLVSSIAVTFAKTVNISIIQESGTSFAVRILCSKHMHVLQSNVHFADACASLTSLAVPWMLMQPAGVQPASGSASRRASSSLVAVYESTHSWSEKESPHMELVVSVVLKCFSKMCTVFSRSSQLPSVLWSMYADLVEAKLSIAFLAVFHRQALQFAWTSFALGPATVDRVARWAAESLLSATVIKFFVEVVVQQSDSQSWASDHEALWRLVLHILCKIDSVWPDEADRLKPLQILEAAFISQRTLTAIPPGLFTQLVQELPLEWDESAPSTLASDTNPLPALAICLTVLRKLGGFEDRMASAARANLRTYVNYVCSLVDKQVKADQFLPVLRFSRPAFVPERLAGIVAETLQVAELVCAGRGRAQDVAADGTVQPAPEQALLYSIQCIISLLNACPRDSKHFARMWEGLNGSARASAHRMTYLSATCLSMASVEHMALLSESCIGWHLTRTCDPQQWAIVTEVMQVPELEESAFIRHCLNHSLAYTLYAHTRKQLAMCQANVELKVSIGEQLGVWIESLRVENAEPGHEGKIMLLILVFGELLQLELSTLVMPDNHSRLRAHLPLIGESLFRWSEDRSSQGIWATLGFGPTSRLTPEFRVCSRIIAVFVTSRLLDAGADEQRTRLFDTLTKLRQSSEYLKLSGLVDDAAGLLHKVVDKYARQLFANWHGLVHPPSVHD
ncbi:hypothetical protein BC831DRAFT_482891 [Entophlyctis helioformis]|nr:hypothetical protein BC831DRAFT_482891 [Entophlyctis helioformis]